MFAGIIETMAQVVSLEVSQEGLRLHLKTSVASQLDIGHSVAHNGVCLTVEEASSKQYTVLAVKETLGRSNISSLKVGDWVNIERALTLKKGIDGHIVTGHVDEKVRCMRRPSGGGVGEWTFSVSPKGRHLLIEKGSIALNGVSLTLYGLSETSFKISLVPHTAATTNLGKLVLGDEVNAEFDVIGKYIQAFFLRNKGFNPSPV